MAIGVHEVCVLDVKVEHRLLSLRMDFVHGSQLEQDWLDRCDVDGMTSRDIVPKTIFCSGFDCLRNKQAWY